jgi:hypothetical protein
MGLSTYTELQATIADFLARSSDPDILAKIPTFIDMAEKRMGRELDTRSQIKRVIASTTAGAEFIELPTDLRKIQTIKLNSNPTKVLDYTTPFDYYNIISSTSSGTPRYYTVIGTSVGLRPIPDSIMEVEMIYSDDIDALSSSVASNTILSRHGDAYLYGSLAAAYVYLMDDARAAQFDQVFTRTISEIKRDTDDAKFGGSLVMRSEYAV